MHKKYSKKAIALLVSLVLVLTVAIGSTIAYLIDKTDQLVNEFEPSKVTVDVVESFDGKVKKEVSIANTGSTAAYIRAAVVITWQDAKGNVYGQMPVEGTDYSAFTSATGWVEHEGFYYWVEPVVPGESTGILIDEITQISLLSNHNICVEILASGIQSAPIDAVKEAWGVDPSKLLG